MHIANKKPAVGWFLIIPGAGTGTQTLDLLLGKEALYQLSYTRIYGGETRTRTEDTRLFRPLLYQLSYLAGVRTSVGQKVLANDTVV